MLITSWAAVWLLRRAQWRPEQMVQRWLWPVLSAMTFSGWVATVAGWYVTEIGRQPYVVQGLIRTADVVTTTPAAHVGWTLIGYAVVYGGLLIAYVQVLRYLATKPLDTSDTPAALPGQATLQGA